MNASQRISRARSSLKKAGHSSSFKNLGNHLEAQVSSTKDTYLTSESQVADFFEAEAAHRGVSLKNGRNDSKSPSTKRAAQLGSRIHRSNNTNRNKKVGKAKKTIQSAARTVPRSVSIAAGAAASAFGTSYLINNPLLGPVFDRIGGPAKQITRVVAPFLVAQVVKRQGGDLPQGVATGMEVDSAVALVKIVASYVPFFSPASEFLSRPVGNTAGTLEGPAFEPVQLPAAVVEDAPARFIELTDSV